MKAAYTEGAKAAAPEDPRLLAYYWLSSLTDFGIVGLEKFVRRCGGIEGVFEVPDEQILGMQEISEKLKAELLRTRKVTEIREAYQRLLSRGIHFVSRDDPAFPEKLRQIEQCPFGLFYIGSLPEEGQPSIAIVGARDASVRGQEIASWFGRELSLAGMQVLSGLALGIDGRAHEGALSGSGCTWGVLGCGLNICYPREHHRLFETMKTHGGLISEFPPGSPPYAWHFPYRNRILSGLCDGILVVEARKKSGSLITANIGLEQGKDIFAVPGRPTDPLSIGCNSLIFDGAALANDPADILEAYHLQPKVHFRKDILLDKLENLVYSTLCLDPKSIEQIAQELDLPYVTVSKTLVDLAAKDLARQIGKNYYIRRL